MFDVSLQRIPGVPGFPGVLQVVGACHAIGTLRRSLGDDEIRYSVPGDLSGFSGHTAALAFAVLGIMTDLCKTPVSDWDA